MAFPVDSGYPSYTGKFIPEVWSGKLLVKFYKSTVFGAIANTDYEGEIRKMGDKVNIRTIPNITIRNYTSGVNLTTEVPESSNVEMYVDKGKYFQFVVDDVQKVQSDIKLIETFSGDASQQMKIAIDSDVLGGVYADAHSSNKGATAGAISGNLDLGATGAPRGVSKSNILDAILDAGQALDENNIPEDGRWMVVPAWFAAMLKKSDLRQAYLTGDDESPLRNGRIGMIDRFTLYVSNNLPNNLDLGSDGSTGGATTAADHKSWHVLAGTNHAITFASQLTEVETIRSQTTFGDIIRGLNVYGYKVVKPQALVDLYCYAA